MNTQSRIFVAGHRGLVGSAVMNELERRGYAYIIAATSSELDLRNQAATLRFFEEHKPEFVFLCAAKVGGIVANNTYKADFIYDNMAIALNVIHSAYAVGVKKLLNLGSSCIYPKFAEQPISENSLLTGLLEPTNEPYAIAKIAAIKLCRYFNEQYHTDFISAMPTNLYGENDNYNLETSHVLPAMMRKFVLAKALNDGNYDLIRADFSTTALGFAIDATQATASEESIRSTLSQFGITEKSITLWGSGSPLREFLHSRDLANACVYIMESLNASAIGEVINVGFGSDISIRDVAQLIKEVVGYKGTIEWDTTKPDGTPRKLMDSSRINTLGWTPSISLRAGLEQTIRKYIATIQAASKNN